MADFDTAVTLVLKNEGGYVNDPDDTPTNYGITLAVYAKYMGKATTASDVQAMPRDVAVKIYRQSYWGAIRGDEIKSQLLANAFMDMAVLRGVSAASITMQTIVGVTADGNVGPKTVAAINGFAPNAVLARFVNECIKRFVAIAQANPVKLKFLMNWVTRAMRLNS